MNNNDKCKNEQCLGKYFNKRNELRGQWPASVDSLESSFQSPDGMPCHKLRTRGHVAVKKCELKKCCLPHPLTRNRTRQASYWLESKALDFLSSFLLLKSLI